MQNRMQSRHISKHDITAALSGQMDIYYSNKHNSFKYENDNIFIAFDYTLANNTCSLITTYWKN